MKNIPDYEELILIDDQYFISLVNDINQSEKSINMETYIFEYDKIGSEIADALLRAAGRGIKIRLLVDGVGSRNWQELQVKMHHQNIIVKPYHPLFLSLFQRPIQLGIFTNIIHSITHINSRNHRKTCIIDNKIVYIGSANITECSSIADKKCTWHDITVRVVGLALDELLFAFEKSWQCISFKNRYHPMANQIELDPVLRLNYSWIKRRFLYKNLLKKIDDCKERLYITSAYFVPRKLLLFKLIEAAKRGINVCIVLPENPDVIGMSLLMSSFYYILLKHGVTIYHYQPGILHTKLLIIDDWFCVGSSNLNYRSLKHDLEVDMKIQTPIAKEKLEIQFNQYCNQSRKITMKDVERHTFLQKIAIKFLWMVRLVF